MVQSPAPSASSSPASFHTAAESEAAHSSTAASSPVHHPQSTFRNVRSLPRELKAHCHIFLEEQLYTGAINLLSSLLGAGSSRRRRTAAAQTVFVPPASHIAVLNSLLVHPAYTNRADKASSEVATLALSYLRSLLAIAGPVNANLRTAFQFYSTPRYHHHRSAYSSDDGLSDDASTDERDRDRDRIAGSLANDHSVWSRGQDFWSTIGWAFNCSKLHPQRWRYWKVWVEFMLDVLEEDWAERERLDMEAHDDAKGAGGPAPTTMRQQSILVMYMEQRNGPQGGFKAIMKALFADGGSLSTSSFHEVFEKEPRGRRQDETAMKKRKRGDRVDVESDKFADYLDDDILSSGTSEPPTPQKPRRRPKAAAASSLGAGLAETIPLRLRLFRLLSAATFALRTTADLDRLYDAYASSLKVLPLDMFAHFIAQRRNPMAAALHVTILKVLFRLLLPSSYKDPYRVDREGEMEGRLSTAMLVHCYVAHPANTIGIEDNAKLSLVVEAGLQLLWAEDMLEYSAALDGAVRKGIEARQHKIRRKRTGRANLDPEDVQAVEVLDASGNRLELLLDAIQATASDDEDDDAIA